MRMTETEARLFSIATEGAQVFLLVALNRWPAWPRSRTTRVAPDGVAPGRAQASEPGLSGDRTRDIVRLALLVAACTLITHPFAWGINEALRGQFSYWPRVGAIELAVSLVEGGLYAPVAGFGWGRGMALGFAANAFSFTLGYWLMTRAAA